MATVKILDKREVPSADPQRIGKFDALITYQADTFRTYIITIPDEALGGPDEDQVVTAAIKADLAMREVWSSKEITV